jgi:hypothetical protein
MKDDHACGITVLLLDSNFHAFRFGTFPEHRWLSYVLNSNREF